MSAPGKSSRRDAWWTALSEAQRWQLYDDTRELTWQASVERAAALTGGTAPSRSAWYRYEAAMRSEQAAHRLELAARARAEAKGLADKAGAAGETAKAFLALATEIALRTGSAEDAEAWTRQATSLYAAAARERGLSIRAEANRLARDRYEAAERRLQQVEQAARGAAGEALSDAERLERIRQIFGMASPAAAPVEGEA